MNLLLLLSALLSAFTGAVTGTRASVPQHVASAAIVAAIEVRAQTATTVAQRPLQPLATLAASAMAPVAIGDIVTHLPAPFESRRRE